MGACAIKDIQKIIGIKMAFSIRKSEGKIIEILRNVDIVVCRETLSLEEGCHILENYDKNLKVMSVSRTPVSSYLGDGRPIGGMTVFCRRHIYIEKYPEN